MEDRWYLCQGWHVGASQAKSSKQSEEGWLNQHRGGLADLQVRTVYSCLVVDDGVPFDKRMLATVSQSELDALVMAARWVSRTSGGTSMKTGRTAGFILGRNISGTEDEDGAGSTAAPWKARPVPGMDV